MDILIEDFITVLRMSAGRRLKVYRSILQDATALAGVATDDLMRANLQALLGHLQRAIEHDEHTLALDVRWVSGKFKPQYNEEAVGLDTQVDDALVGIRDFLQSYGRGLRPGHPNIAVAKALLGDIFPNGVNAIIRLPFVEQAPAVTQIVGTLQSDQTKPVVVSLGLLDRVDYLAELSVRYQRAVDLTRNDLQFATVRTARDEGHRYLLEVVATIFGIYRDSRDPEQVATRTKLLAHIQAQQELVRQKLRAARRGSGDSTDDGTEDEIEVPDTGAAASAAVNPSAPEPAAP